MRKSEPVEPPQPWKPHAYQKRAVKFLIERGGAGLFMDPGLGKTSCVLAAFELLRRKRMVKRMLVVAPLRVCRLVWPAEAAKWKDFAHLKVSVLHGKEKNTRIDDDADVHVINPEGLPWYLERARRSGLPWPGMLVVDESTLFKNPKSKRFRLLQSVLFRFRRRVILTGTPAPNGLQDIWAQVFLLDAGASLGASFMRFRQRFFLESLPYTWALRRGAEKEIYDLLSNTVLRLDEDDYLELPPLIRVDVPVELPPQAMRTYRELESEMRVMLEDSTSVRAASAAALTTKCRQLANGAVYVDGDESQHEYGRAWRAIHDAKLDALEEVLEELSGKPTLIAYEYDHDALRIMERFGEMPAIGGLFPMHEDDEAELARRWNDGRVPQLLVQPSSASHGLNLQRGGRALVWFGLTWNLEHYDQMVKRIHRQGQKKRVFLYELVARGTVDMDVSGALRRKHRTQRALLDALRARLGVAPKPRRKK